MVFISYKYYAIRETTANTRHYINGQVVWEGLVRSTELAWANSE